MVEISCFQVLASETVLDSSLCSKCSIVWFFLVEIANTCAFLASDKSSYITGATIEVTGMKQWLIHKFIYMFINQHKIDIVSIPSLFSLIITNICIFFCRWSFYVKQSEESESKLIKKKRSSLWYKYLYKVIKICKQWHNRWINWSQWFLVIIEIWYEDICVSVMASLAGDGLGQEWCWRKLGSLSRLGIWWRSRDLHPFWLVSFLLYKGELKNK